MASRSGGRLALLFLTTSWSFQREFSRNGPDPLQFPLTQGGMARAVANLRCDRACTKPQLLMVGPNLRPFRREFASQRCRPDLHTSDRSELDSISFGTPEQRSWSLQAVEGFHLPSRRTSHPASGPGRLNGACAHCVARHRTSRVSQSSRRCRVYSTCWETEFTERLTFLTGRV